MRVHPPVRAQKLLFEVEFGPGHVTSGLILKHKVVIIYLHVIFREY
jgi:hypothetical protein